jgi:hypothetical protein
VRVPTDQAPLFHVPGLRGGWFISLLFGHGSSVGVPMQELGKLLAGSRGEGIVARRLTHKEAGVLESRRADCDADVHARLVAKEEERFRRPRRGGDVDRRRGGRSHAGQ